MAVGKDDLPSGSGSSPPEWSLRTMMTTAEKVTQKSTTLPRLSVHHMSFL